MCNPRAMSEHVVAAPPRGHGGESFPYAAGAQHAAEHEGAPWGWALWGLLQATAGQPLDVLLHARIHPAIGTSALAEATEMEMAVGGGAEARIAMADPSALLKRSGLDLSEVLAAPPREAGEEEEEAEAEAGAEAVAAAAAEAKAAGTAPPLAPKWIAHAVPTSPPESLSSDAR